ncbi:hypothetical protein SGPA1_12611 [Streptomyces misionensis JCM 4497]
MPHRMNPALVPDMCSRIRSRPIGRTPNPAAARTPINELIRTAGAGDPGKSPDRTTHVTRHMPRHAVAPGRLGVKPCLSRGTAGHLPARTRQLTSQA